MDRFLLCSLAAYNQRVEKPAFKSLVSFTNNEYGFVTHEGDLVLITSILSFVSRLQQIRFRITRKGDGFKVLYYGPTGVEGFIEESKSLEDSYKHHGLVLSRKINNITPIEKE